MKRTQHPEFLIVHAQDIARPQAVCTSSLDSIVRHACPVHRLRRASEGMRPVGSSDALERMDLSTPVSLMSVRGISIFTISST